MSYPTARQLIDRNIIDPLAVQVFDRGDVLGRSVRANRSFKIGEKICSYGGKRIAKHVPVDSAYKVELDSETIIDGDPRHEETRDHVGSFINDAKGVVQFLGQRNNVVFKRSWFFDGTRRQRIILVVASRPIRAGEELWLSYGIGYWNTYRRENKTKTVFVQQDKKIDAPRVLFK